MLTIENLSVRYGKKEVLSAVSTHIEKESITAIVGKNGSGKSTLLSCLTGTVAYTGSILLNGTPLQTLPPKERAKKISLMPQLLPDTALTVQQLALLGRSAYLGFAGRYSNADTAAVANALQLAQMESFADRSVQKLSGGERQRAFLAMLLAQDTPLMAFDEPTAHLDTTAAAAFENCLRMLVQKEKKTVLVVSHDLSAAANLADTILCLHEGRLVFAGTTKKFTDSQTAESIFGVRKTFFTDSDGCQRVLYYR